MTTARKMICALAEVVQRNESTANLSYDDTDSSLGRDSLNTSERKRSLLRKDGSADSTSRGEEANGGLDGSIGKRWSCSKGTSNRRCKVMPMVMGHVLQQPKLALPKMDPQTLRAIARENREVGE
ncbi:hypothetical protein FHG87_020786 [Trinorchestia longiramus]|nr:hypothetical protein FHG87_020786 [Trinorchestia longiramus]